MSVVGFSAGCLGGDDEGEDEEEVDHVVTVAPDSDFGFDPGELEIDPGETVRFEWDSSGHTLVPTDQPEGSDWEGVSDRQQKEYTHTHTFEIEGAYPYECRIHSHVGMTAYILVGDAEPPEDGGGRFG